MRSRRMKRSPTQPTVSAAPSPKIRPVRAPRSMAPSTCQWSLRYQTRSWLMSIGLSILPRGSAFQPPPRKPLIRRRSCFDVCSPYFAVLLKEVHMIRVAAVPCLFLPAGFLGGRAMAVDAGRRRSDGPADTRGARRRSSEISMAVIRMAVGMLAGFSMSRVSVPGSCHLAPSGVPARSEPPVLLARVATGFGDDDVVELFDPGWVLLRTNLDGNRPRLLLRLRRVRRVVAVPFAAGALSVRPGRLRRGRVPVCAARRSTNAPAPSPP